MYALLPAAGTLFPARPCTPSRQPGCWAKRTAAWDSATELANICGTAWEGTRLQVLLTEYVASGMPWCGWKGWARKFWRVSWNCKTGGREELRMRLLDKTRDGVHHGQSKEGDFRADPWSSSGSTFTVSESGEWSCSICSPTSGSSLPRAPLSW